MIVHACEVSVQNYVEPMKAAADIASMNDLLEGPPESPSVLLASEGSPSALSKPSPSAAQGRFLEI